jgi:hypothetical protein
VKEVSILAVVPPVQRLLALKCYILYGSLGRSPPGQRSHPELSKVFAQMQLTPAAKTST